MKDTICKTCRRDVTGQPSVFRQGWWYHLEHAPTGGGNWMDEIPDHSMVGRMPYTHEQLWELAWKWWRIAENPVVDEGTRYGYKECADQLTELLGPLAFATWSHAVSQNRTELLISGADVVMLDVDEDGLPE